MFLYNYVIIIVRFLQLAKSTIHFNLETSLGIWLLSAYFSLHCGVESDGGRGVQIR